MSIFTSALVAVFCISVVFVVLTTLYVLIRLFTAIVGATRKPKSTPKIKTETDSKPIAEPVSIISESAAAPKEMQNASAGIIKLNNVDEKTAAMVMAIVSHEIEIPLSQLRFKSVRCIEE